MIGVENNRTGAKLIPLAFAALLLFSPSLAPQTVPAPSAQSQARPVGTIKAISGNNITLATDKGVEITVQIQDATKFLRIAPGQTDLKEATPIQLSDIQVGDRVLVRGALADDGKTVLANSLIAMKQADIADKQTKDREEWQRRGVGGLVHAVDPPARTITVSVSSLGSPKLVLIHLSKDTVLRRYSPDSVKFDDAKPAPLDQVKPGDQLRARGAKNADGSELTADEIVSGTFRNIAGTISSIDATANSLTVRDMATKKDVLIKITSESQLRKLTPPIAARIALRLRGNSGDPAALGEDGATAPSAPPSKPAGAPVTRAPGPPDGRAGMGRPGGSPDLQQAIARMPAATLADLQKGDAVMLVATQGTQNGGATAITLLGGVEPILQASPQSAATILSPWSLGSGAPGGEAGTP